MLTTHQFPCLFNSSFDELKTRVVKDWYSSASISQQATQKASSWGSGVNPGQNLAIAPGVPPTGQF